MAAVWMFIEKFGGVVFINEDNPLAIAQRAKDSGGAASASGSPEPAATVPSAAVAPAPAPPDMRSFADLRAAAKVAGINTYQMGADDIRAALRGL
jgi:hypothetical protein